MSDTIIMIGREDDTHIPFVERHLHTSLTVVDPAKSISGTELSFAYHDSRLHVIYDGSEIEHVRSVWFRKPRPIRGDTLNVDPAYRPYSETAILSHVREFYMHFSDALWISDYYAIRRADYKGLQLDAASKLGFAIPDTLSTSDSNAAQKFIETHPATIVKSLATVFPTTTANEPTMFYSKKIYPGQNFDLSGLHLAPSIFQQAINHKLDIRVTVVGKKVFAAAINASEVDDKLSLRDWRPAYFYGTLTIEPYQLPKALEDKCIALVHKLGLQYGAIDLIYDQQGTYWFLENNPNGEWAFVEHVTNQPIGKAIAELLSQGGGRTG